MDANHASGSKKMSAALTLPLEPTGGEMFQLPLSTEPVCKQSHRNKQEKVCANDTACFFIARRADSLKDATTGPDAKMHTL